MGSADPKLSANLPNFPCHTQSVERAVKLVTEASLKVHGIKERDGHTGCPLIKREY